jgi:ferredoxin
MVGDVIMPKQEQQETCVKAKWQIEVHPSSCIGSGSCIVMARQQFSFDEQRHSRALHEVIDPDNAVLNAALSCPVDAIRIVEIEGDQTRVLAGNATSLV